MCAVSVGAGSAFRKFPARLRTRRLYAGRDAGRLSFGYFDQPSAVEKRLFAVQRKVTRAKRETLLLRFKQQRVQALEKEKARPKWMTSHSAVVEHFQRSLG